MAEWVRRRPDLAEHGVGDWLRDLAMPATTTRPSVFRDNLGALVDEALPEDARGNPLELCWQRLP